MRLASINELKKYYLDRLVLDIEKFEILDNQKIGLVGANGQGKTTFIKALLGEISVDEGEVHLTDSYSYISQTGDAEIFCEDSEIKSILNAPDSFREGLSGGEKMKLKIANALKEKKKLIIADEPTSNLDKESIEVLENMFRSYNGAMLLVSHDRKFLDSLCNIIVEIEDGKLTVYSGNYTTYLSLKEEKRKKEESEYEKYIAEKKKIEKAIVEKKTLRSGMRKTPKRMGNSEARLHRMGNQSGEKKVDSSVNAMKTRLDKLEVKEKPKDISEMKIYIQDNMEIGSKNLIEVSNLKLSIGDKILLEDEGFKIKKNKKVALLGENGCGKSTLVKEIIKNNNPSIRLHPKLKIGYFDQSQELLDGTKSILDNIKNVSSFKESFIRTNLNLFGFKGEEVYKKVNILSGGERVKIALCKIILEDNNILILDEPTNYLDIISINALEKALKNTEKTMIIVSHDREFINNICDTTIEIKDKKFKVFDGIYSEFKADVNTEKLNETEKKINDEILVLENKLSNIISMLCVEIDLKKKEEYDKSYNETLERLKLLKNNKG